MTIRRLPAVVRIRARLRDERGFSVVETLIAITVIFGSLITLAFTTTSGLRYLSIGRERQAANQLANQLMEQARGLAYGKITKGMQASDLASDTNLVTGCGGDPVGAYRFRSCTGELVVSTALNCPTVASDCATPLVPNSGTIGQSAEYPVDYDWRTYVTNDCPTESATCAEVKPYTVTVILTWTDPNRSGQVQEVLNESLFWSPQGCISSQTHPFAAPCQPFFFSQALAPEGLITVAGTIDEVDFVTGSIISAGAEATFQQEQVQQVQSSWTSSGTMLTTSAGEQLGGSAVLTAAADGDPAGTTPPYAATNPATTGSASTLFAEAGSTRIQFSNAAGDAGHATSATSAGGANVCPPTPPAPPAESDLAPCGGARVLQAGTAQIVGQFNGFDVDDDVNLGNATLASIANPSTATTAFANRMLVSGQNGNVQNTVSRYIGTVRVGELPAAVSGPSNWSGYFLQLTGYRDTVVSTAGTSAAAPTATVNSGTLSYWNGNGYTSVNLATTPAYSLSGLLLDHTTTVGSNTVRVRIASDGPIAMQSAPTTSSTPTGGGSILRNLAEATVGSPVFGVLDYEIWLDGVQVTDLTIVIALETVVARSTYEPAPAAG